MTTNKQLHWTQRLALVQHNLHAASRTGNFTFFSNIQSAHFLSGTDYVANLTAKLGDEADKLFSVLDNLNSGIAWSHEEAFKAVYEGLKDAASSTAAINECATDHTKALLDRVHSDIVTQRASADATIDKMMSSAVTIIQQEPFEVHDDAAQVFMLGTTFIADAVQVCLSQLHVLESCIPDTNMARAESAYALVRFAVSAAVSALKGVLNMMEAHDNPAGEAAAAHARRASVASTASFVGGSSSRSRAISRTSSDQASGHLTASNSNSNNENGSAWNVFRRVSNAFQGSGSASRKPSIASMYSSSGSSDSTTPHAGAAASSHNNGVTFAPPTFVGATLKSPPVSHKRGVSMPAPAKPDGHVLSPILATPQAHTEALKNPFESSFAVGRKREGILNRKGTLEESPSGTDVESSKEEEGPMLVDNEKAWVENQEVVEQGERAKFVNEEAEGRSSAVDHEMKGRAGSAGSAGMRHGRRRSTEVRSMPPELEALRISSTEAGASV